MSLPEVTPESVDYLEDIINPDNYLAAAECQPGQVYWQRSANLGSVVVCQGETPEGLAFTGWRSKTELPGLATDYHLETSQLGSVRPYWPISETPPNDNLLDWLIQKEVEIRRQRMGQLKAIDPATWPNDLLPTIIENEQASIDQLTNPQPLLNIKDVVAKKSVVV